MRNILPFDLRRNIYISFIEPHFNQCAQTWHFFTKSLAEKLEKVNERAIRFVFRDKHTTYEELLKLLCRRTLKEQRMNKILCSVFRLVNNKTNPESLNELISLRETTYALRGKDISKVQKVNTTRFGLNSRRYQAPKIWNNLLLPDVVRASSDFKTFKKLLENESLFQYRRIAFFYQFCK